MGNREPTAPSSSSSPSPAISTSAKNSNQEQLHLRHRTRKSAKDSGRGHSETSAGGLNRYLQGAFIVIVLLSCSYFMFSGSNVAKIKRAPANVDNVPSSCKKDRQIAMTLDDGPGLATDKYLDDFKDQNVKVTFHFYPGIIDQFQNGPVFVKRAASEGHVIGIRFDPNQNVMNLSSSDLAKTLAAYSDSIYKLIGRYPKYLRFNYQQYDQRVLDVATSMGFVVTQHNIDSGDYKYAQFNGNPGGEIHRAYYQQLDNNPEGSFISLHHDLNAAAATITKDLVANVKARGYTFVTLNDCLGDADAYRGNNDVPQDLSATNSGTGGNSGTTSTVQSKSSTSMGVSVSNVSISSMFLFVVIGIAALII